MKKFIMLVLSLACAQEMVVTREYTDFLKKHVSWEVTEYEDNVFRGWTAEEFKSILMENIPSEGYIPNMDPVKNLPSSVNWAHSKCDHGVRNVLNCGGSCWAFAAAGMLGDRCCLQEHDHGFLSIQELISCDPKSHGCRGGWCTWAMEYVKSANGLVPEACYPYQARNTPCPTSCFDNSNWKNAHVCACPSYKSCIGVDSMKTCLQSGPITAVMYVCRSFHSYKSGIYQCDCDIHRMGYIAVAVMGYSEEPEPNFYARNNWGISWGNAGYFNIAVETCNISGTYENGSTMCEKIANQFFILI